MPQHQGADITGAHARISKPSSVLPGCSQQPTSGPAERFFARDPVNDGLGVRFGFGVLLPAVPKKCVGIFAGVLSG